MNILTISGSAQDSSSNQRLLEALPGVISEHRFSHFEGLIDFPLFTTAGNENPPALVLDFKRRIADADVVVIATPEYVHNIPAVLKNALEWITSSGEFNEKKVIAITYTPSSPRGENAMQSLITSLKALNAKVVCEMQLYRSELVVSEDGALEGEESIAALNEVFALL